jgi:hypothetical protein
MTITLFFFFLNACPFEKFEIKESSTLNNKPEQHSNERFQSVKLLLKCYQVSKPRINGKPTLKIKSKLKRYWTQMKISLSNDLPVFEKDEESDVRVKKRLNNSIFENGEPQSLKLYYRDKNRRFLTVAEDDSKPVQIWGANIFLFILHLTLRCDFTCFFCSFFLQETIKFSCMFPT